MDTLIADEVPWSERVTDYDRAHFVVYLRLLDARAAEAAPGEMALAVLGINPAKEPQRAAKALESHLRREQWMTTNGYRQLLTQGH